MTCIIMEDRFVDVPSPQENLDRIVKELCVKIVEKHLKDNITGHVTIDDLMVMICEFIGGAYLFPPKEPPADVMKVANAIIEVLAKHGWQGRLYEKIEEYWEQGKGRNLSTLCLDLDYAPQEG